MLSLRYTSSSRSARSAAMIRRGAYSMAYPCGQTPTHIPHWMQSLTFSPFGSPSRRFRNAWDLVSSGACRIGCIAAPAIDVHLPRTVGGGSPRPLEGPRPRREGCEESHISPTSEVDGPFTSRCGAHAAIVPNNYLREWFDCALLRDRTTRASSCSG